MEIAVSDLTKSRQWYAKLFGKKGPDLEPFAGNVEFKVGGAWVQIVNGEVQPSSSWSLQLEVIDISVSENACVRRTRAKRAVPEDRNQTQSLPPSHFAAIVFRMRSVHLPSAATLVNPSFSNIPGVPNPVQAISFDTTE